MKMKSLLLAAAAFVALGLNAQETTEPAFTWSASDITINDESQLDQLMEIELTVARPGGIKYKMWQLNLSFPDGIYPISKEVPNPNYDADEAAEYAEAGEPYEEEPTMWIYGESGNTNVMPSDNFNNEENWPDYIVVSANMTGKGVITPKAYKFFVTAPADKKPANGTYEMKLYAKTIGEDDSDNYWGTEEEPLHLLNVTFDLPEDPSTAVSDVNAAKTVASVKYMNAAGMVSDTAFQGVNIVVTKYADGTQSTAKVVK